jgi:hypothetical protein
MYGDGLTRIIRTYVFSHVCVFAVQAVAFLINVVPSASVIGHVANEGTLPLADQYKKMWNHQWLQLRIPGIKTSSAKDSGEVTCSLITGV